MWVFIKSLFKKKESSNQKLLRNIDAYETNR